MLWTSAATDASLPDESFVDAGFRPSDAASTGRDFRLETDEYVAHVSAVGASLRSLTFRGRDLVLPFGADEARPHYRGAILAPWPNRVVDGRYVFGGTVHSLEITEPDRGHALHGLVAWSDFALVTFDRDRLRLATSLRSPKGYPHEIDIHVEYALGPDGLRTRVRAINVGNSVAPFGTGPHPYLLGGEGTVDDWTLEIPAQEVMEVSARLAPLGTVPVTDPRHGDYDFRAPRSLEGVFLDHAYTGLTESRATLTTRGGTGVGMTWDSRCPWVQVHTADLPDKSRSRLGLAVEPMTCPPDAFNSGRDLIRVEPGARTSAEWRIFAIA